jgi:hypothetical protein
MVDRIAPMPPLMQVEGDFLQMQKYPYDTDADQQAILQYIENNPNLFPDSVVHLADEIRSNGAGVDPSDLWNQLKSLDISEVYALYSLKDVHPIK